jgi:hypothetical protein
MAATAFENLGDGFRQAIQSSFETLTEQNTPTWSHIKKSTEAKPVTEKGWKIPYNDRMPGGHKAFTASSPDFNAAVGPQSTAMYVYPVRYALPIQFDGGFIRAFNAGRKDAIVEYQRIMDLYYEAAAKRTNQMCYGDGSGTLAYITNNEATGSQTIECDTTAAAGYGHTKGAKWLIKNHVYDCVTPGTGTVTSSLTITTEGSSSCVGTFSSDPAAGDVIVDTGSFNNFFRGFAHLNSNTSRTLQGLATGTFPALNSYGVDLNGALLTVSTIAQIKAGLKVRNNADDAQNGLVAFVPPGQLYLLRVQGYNLSQYIRNTDDGDVVKGVAKMYKDGDTLFVEDADCDEDRGYFFDMSQISRFEEMPFGDYDIGGSGMHMAQGANSTGSDVYYKGIGWVGNLGVTGVARSMAFFKRAAISDSVTQVNAG